MKTIISLIFLLIVYIGPLQAQHQDPDIKLDSIVCGSELKEFIYEDPGRLSQIVTWVKGSQISSVGRYIDHITKIEYNSNGSIDRIVGYGKDMGELKLYSRTNLTYDGNGHLIELACASDIFGIDSLEVISKFSILYDKDGKIQGAEQFENIWGPLWYHVAYSYNENGNISRYFVTVDKSPVLGIDYNWNSTGQLESENWTTYPSYKSTVQYTYNSEGDLASKESTHLGRTVYEGYNYNTAVEASRIVDFTFPELQALYPVGLLNPIQFMPSKQLIEVETGSNKWGKTTKHKYYYSSLEGSATSSIDELDYTNFFHIYPNPAENYLVIGSSRITGNVRLKIMDIAGRTIMDKVVELGQEVSVSRLPVGLYLYCVEDKDNSFAGKLIVK